MFLLARVDLPVSDNINRYVHMSSELRFEGLLIMERYEGTLAVLDPVEDHNDELTASD